MKHKNKVSLYFIALYAENIITAMRASITYNQVHDTVCCNLSS